MTKEGFQGQVPRPTKITQILLFNGKRQTIATMFGDYGIGVYQIRGYGVSYI
jgi:hypothetical protein